MHLAARRSGFRTEHFRCAVIWGLQAPAAPTGHAQHPCLAEHVGKIEVQELRSLLLETAPRTEFGGALC